MSGGLDQLGEVVREGGGVLLRFERSYEASPDEVWAALTEPDRMARWLGRWSGDPASGQVLLTMTDEAGTPAEPVVIDRCEPPVRLDVTMATGDGAWPLRLQLSEHGGRTTLLFEHQLAEPYDASSLGPGWQYYLDRLGAVVDGAPVPAEFDDYFPRLADRYVVPDAVQG